MKPSRRAFFGILWFLMVAAPGLALSAENLSSGGSSKDTVGLCSSHCVGAGKFALFVGAGLSGGNLNLNNGPSYSAWGWRGTVGIDKAFSHVFGIRGLAEFGKNSYQNNANTTSTHETASNNFYGFGGSFLFNYFGIGGGLRHHDITVTTVTRTNGTTAAYTGFVPYGVMSINLPAERYYGFNIEAQYQTGAVSGANLQEISAQISLFLLLGLQ